MGKFIMRSSPDIAPKDLAQYTTQSWRTVAEGGGSPTGTIPSAEDIEGARRYVAEQQALKAEAAKLSPAEVEALAKQRRGQAVKNFYADQKARRWAVALHTQGIPAADLAAMDDPAAIAEGGVKSWDDVRDELVSNGLLKVDDTVPKSSKSLVTKYLKQLEGSPQAKAAAQ
jgi:hypothetical protein